MPRNVRCLYLAAVTSTNKDTETIKRRIYKKYSSFCFFGRWWSKVDIRYNRHNQLDNMNLWIRRQEELITKTQEQVFEVSDVVVGYYFLWSIFGNKAAAR